MKCRLHAQLRDKNLILLESRKSGYSILNEDRKDRYSASLLQTFSTPILYDAEAPMLLLGRGSKERGEYPYIRGDLGRWDVI